MNAKLFAKLQTLGEIRRRSRYIGILFAVRNSRQRARKCFRIYTYYTLKFPTMTARGCTCVGIMFIRIGVNFPGGSVRRVKDFKCVF